MIRAVYAGESEALFRQLAQEYEGQPHRFVTKEEHTKLSLPRSIPVLKEGDFDGYDELCDLLDSPLISLQKYDQSYTQREFRTVEKILKGADGLSLDNFEDFVSLLIALNSDVMKSNSKGFRQCGATIPARDTSQTLMMPHYSLVPQILMRRHAISFAMFETYPVAAAAILYQTIILSHPFIDGNGRTARSISNILIQKAFGRNTYIPFMPFIVSNDRFLRSFTLSLRRSLIGGEWKPFINHFSFIVRFLLK